MGNGFRTFPPSYPKPFAKVGREKMRFNLIATRLVPKEQLEHRKCSFFVDETERILGIKFHKEGDRTVLNGGKWSAKGGNILVGCLKLRTALKIPLGHYPAWWEEDLQYLCVDFCNPIVKEDFKGYREKK